MHDAPVSTVARLNGALSYQHLRSRDVVKRGKRTPGVQYRDQHADVVPGKSIRLHGMYGGQPYDRTFAKGDFCEYARNGLVYYARIIAIGERTVTVNDEDFKQIDTMELPEFSNRNRNFDPDNARKNVGSVRVSAK